MGNRPTMIQRLFRRPMNWLVETVYPESMFYGKNYLRPFERIGIEKNMSAAQAAAMYLVCTLRDANADDAEFEFREMTSKGEPAGSWRLKVTEILDDTGEKS